MTTVSVVIPTFNCAPFIAKTILSALEQGTSEIDVEVIVIDDGSTDNTAEVVKTFGESVKYHRQNNGGVSRARNQGISKSTGEYLYFLDADDILVGGWFELAISKFREHPEVGVVYGALRYWTAGPEDDPSITLNSIKKRERTLPVIHDQNYSGRIYAKMLCESCILCSSAMIRKKIALSAQGFEEGIPMGEDWSFWIRVSRECPVLMVQRTIVLYRQHVPQASRKVRDFNYAACVIKTAVEKYGLSDSHGSTANWLDVKLAISKTYRWHATAHFLDGKYFIGLNAITKAVFYYPFHLGSLRLLAGALLGLGRYITRNTTR